jgi:hypothetical protein
MVKTCANPVCAAPFRYWRGGKLFRCDVRTPCEPCPDVPDHICQPKLTRSSAFFWLCKNCCSTMTLSFDPYKGLAVVPLKNTGRHTVTRITLRRKAGRVIG